MPYNNGYINGWNEIGIMDSNNTNSIVNKLLYEESITIMGS